MAAFHYDNGFDARGWTGSIADILRAQGEIPAAALLRNAQINADAARQNGQLVGGAIANVGNTVAGAIQQANDPHRKLADLQYRETAKAVAEKDTLQGLIKSTPKVDLGGGVMGYDIPALSDAIAAKGGDPKAILDHVGPVNDALQQMHAGRVATVKNGALALQAAGNDPTLAGDFLDLLDKNHIASPTQLQQFRTVAATPEGVAKLTAYFAGPQKMERGAPGSVAVNPITGLPVEGSQIPDKPERPLVVGPGAIAVDPKTGATVATGPAKEPAPKSLQMKSVLVDGKPTEASYNPADGSWQVGGQAIEPARIKPIPTQTSVTIQQGQSDAKSIADAIIAGDQPPDVKGLYRLAGPVRAELAKQGYDMTKANLDWEATKKHLSTLNGAQQTRLRQAISTASDSLGVIEDLAKQWDGGKFPLLNKASLVAATNGALGPKAQQIATNLTAQITDVTSELGNVYMGGNSPTDHALSLAGKNLSADWTRDQLLSAIKLARTNLTIRNNSIVNSGAMLSGGPVTPPAAATTIRARDPKGVLHEAPAGTALPAGWKLEP